MYDERDEISLRDLYLTLRRGLPVILIITVLAVVVAVLFAGLGGRRYQAAATVQVTPLTVKNAAADTLDLSSATTIDFETYQALAYSPSVLDAAGEPFGSDRPSRAALRSALSLSRLTIPNSTSLVVRHTVTNADPERAAAVANAWAEATRSAAETAVVSALGRVSSGVASQAEQVRQTLDEAEAAWQTFQQNDARIDLRARLSALSLRASQGRQRLDDLDRLEATATAQQGLLTAIVTSADSGNTTTLNAQLQALQANGMVDPALFDALLQALSALGAGDSNSGLSLTYAIAQTKIQQQTAELAGYVAERETIQAQLDGFDEQAATLRTELARLERTANEVGRTLSQAQNAYEQVLGIAPQLAVMTDLISSGANVLSEAVAPEFPEPTHRTTTALAGAAAGLVIGAFLVFLRAAIAEPKSSRPAAVPADAGARRTSP